jgi:alpha-beta hydrolase superfamily lysophospholipase
MTPETRDPARPDTVVLIHGLWMTARCWEHWVDRYTRRGYRVIARSWPGMEGDIEELRRDPSVVAGLGVTEIVDHYDGIIRALERPPIIIGHSFGGLFTEILLDRGLGAAGVAIAPAAPQGILKTPLSTLRVGFPALSNPAHLHEAAPLTPEQFRYAFGNTLTEEESAAAYARYAVPGPDRVLFQAGLADFNPHAATHVAFRNDNRAPLLLIAGGKDHVSPASLTEDNYKHYSHSKAITAYKEYPERSHFTLGEAGWEGVADYALDWAARHAAPVQESEPSLR